VIVETRGGSRSVSTISSPMTTIGTFNLSLSAILSRAGSFPERAAYGSSAGPLAVGESEVVPA
jgi:hypothetical protein